MKLRTAKYALFILGFLLLTSCSEQPIVASIPGGGHGTEINIDQDSPVLGSPIRIKNSDSLLLYPAEFDSLPGWTEDDHVAAFSAFRHSCKRWSTMPSDKTMAGIYELGHVSDWQTICDMPTKSGEERLFFEKWFKPYAVEEQGSFNGLFTGYYLPELHGSLTKTERYNVPIYRKPDDLVTVGKKSGRMVNGHLEPYYDRRAINEGALEDKDLELLWVDDAVDAYFMEVQGSGRVLMEDGSVKTVGYAAKNGRGYFAIGKELVDRGIIPREQVSMQTIRDWIKSHPAEGQELMQKNASYVFFHFTSHDASQWPVGAMGVPLTTQRSLAIDRHYLPLGIPIWLDAEHPQGGKRLKRLVVAQDTGGAIKGAIRGDFYCGQGSKAAEMAGPMKSKGRFYLLVPRTVYPN
jgi:membrane-bound lytic murein transglycosylase A